MHLLRIDLGVEISQVTVSVKGTGFKKFFPCQNLEIITKFTIERRPIENTFN